MIARIRRLLGLVPPVAGPSMPPAPTRRPVFGSIRMPDGRVLPTMEEAAFRRALRASADAARQERVVASERASPAP